MKVLKTERFIGFGALDAVFQYQDFIKKNSGIEVVSVNVMDNNILLTYY